MPIHIGCNLAQGNAIALLAQPQFERAWLFAA